MYREKEEGEEKMPNDGATPDADEELSPRDKFRVKSFIPIVDALYTNLNKRATVYNYVAEKFSFLVDLHSSEEQLCDAVTAIIKEYPNDVDMNLLGELKHFHVYVKQNYPKDEHVSHKFLYQIIYKDKIHQAFPNVEGILRLFLCLMVTNCSGERSFSQLKRIKNELRTNMSQDRLAALSLLCIESDKLRCTPFDEIIDDFAREKSRKRMF